MTSTNRQRQGQRPGAEARFFDGDGIAQAEAWAYLRNKDKSKDQYGDSGCARMTTPLGGCARMTNKRQATAGSFDCAQDRLFDSPSASSGSLRMTSFIR